MEHLLHDFTFFAKSSGYLAALVVLLAIVPFWIYLIGGENKRKKSGP